MNVENLGTATTQLQSADYRHGAIEPRYFQDLIIHKTEIQIFM